MWSYFAIYLLVGVAAVGVFDLLTKRVRRRLAAAADKTRITLIVAGFGDVGARAGVVALLAVIVLFWPALFYGVLESYWRRGNAKSKQS